MDCTKNNVGDLLNNNSSCRTIDETNTLQRKNSNTVININNNSQNSNNTIINRLTLNVVNNNTEKQSTSKYKYISNIDSARENNKDSKNTFLVDSNKKIISPQTNIFDRINSSNSSKNTYKSILDDFKKSKNLS